MRKSSEQSFAFIPLLLVCAFFICKAVNAPVHDFANYYFGGYLWGHGQFTREIYFPYWFNQQIVALGHPPVFAGFAPNTPFLAMLFCPLAALDIMTAKLLFNILGVLLFFYSLRRLAVFYAINPIYILLIPGLFLIPIRNEIMFGQVYFLLFFLLAESWLAYEKGQHWKTAIFLAAAIMLKVFPGLLLLPFIFRRQFRIVLYTLACCLAFSIATLPLCPAETWIFYLTDVLAKASNGEVAAAYVVNYQSAFMFLKQWLVFDTTENPGGIFANPLWFRAIIFTLKVAVISIGWYVSKKVTSPLFVFGYWIVACIFLSPYGSTYTFVLMLFPFFAVVRTAMPTWKAALMAILVFALFNFPLSTFVGSPFPLSYLRLFCLLSFFVLMLSLCRHDISWKMTAIASLVAVALYLSAAGPENDESDYFLKPNSPLLVYDYKIENNKLTICYWNENGRNTQTIPADISSVARADLTRNTVYYLGKKLVSDRSHKLKPVVINGNTLLYLSDLDRGIGFYTLRKTELR